MVNLSYETKFVYDKVAGAGANCEGFRVAELRVRQLKIGRKSCFA